ncbi:hypothetical protein LJR230_003995 [Trinickia sp. LjRoot230]|uniref:hypothetical protein n=1 Tax=Trinickia sp. LjRoot230 TaxID=3342288 RepID=UPI003ECC75E7
MVSVSRSSDGGLSGDDSNHTEHRQSARHVPTGARALLLAKLADIPRKRTQRTPRVESRPDVSDSTGAESRASRVIQRALQQHVLPVADAIGLDVTEETGHPQGVATLANLATSFGVDVTHDDLRCWSLLLTISTALDVLVDEDGVADIAPHAKQLTEGRPIKGVTQQEATRFASVFKSLSAQKQASIMQGTALAAFAERQRDAKTVDAFRLVRCEEADMLAGILSMELRDGAADRGARLAFNQWMTHFSRAANLLDSLMDLRADYEQGLISIPPSVSNRGKLSRLAATELHNCVRGLPRGTIAPLFLASVSKALRDAAGLPPSDYRYRFGDPSPSEHPFNRYWRSPPPERFVANLPAQPRDGNRSVYRAARLPRPIERVLEPRVNAALRRNSIHSKLAQIFAMDVSLLSQAVSRLPRPKLASVETIRNVAQIKRGDDVPYTFTVNKNNRASEILVRSDLESVADVRMQEEILWRALGGALLHREFCAAAEVAAPGLQDGAASWFGRMIEMEPAGREDPSAYATLLAHRVRHAVSRGIGTDDIREEDLGLKDPVQAWLIEQVAARMGRHRLAQAALLGQRDAIDEFSRTAASVVASYADIIRPMHPRHDSE